MAWVWKMPGVQMVVSGCFVFLCLSTWETPSDLPDFVWFGTGSEGLARIERWEKCSSVPEGFCEQGCTMWRLWKVQSQGLLFFSSKTQISDPKVLDEIWLPCNLGSPKSWQSCIGIESAGEEGGQILWKGWMWGNWVQHDDIVLVCIDKLLAASIDSNKSSIWQSRKSCEKSYPSPSTFSHLLTKKNSNTVVCWPFFKATILKIELSDLQTVKPFVKSFLDLNVPLQLGPFHSTERRGLFEGLLLSSRPISAFSFLVYRCV